MSIFGSKSNVAGVVILYDADPPTSGKQDEILAEVSKRVKLQARLLGTSKVTEGQRATKAVWDAYVKAVTAIKIAQAAIPFMDEPKTKVESFGPFTVVTVTGRK